MVSTTINIIWELLRNMRRKGYGYRCLGMQWVTDSYHTLLKFQEILNIFVYLNFKHNLLIIECKRKPTPPYLSSNLLKHYYATNL